MTTTSPYPHRQNKDGSTDSICPKCFVTIVTEGDAASSDGQEERHVCLDSVWTKVATTT